ncbi:MAG TPA: hypothetical protein VMI54_06860 [Polyangiaceae bacterium]|nr:hypothetical protein [Polyangiaceae bacterium]
MSDERDRDEPVDAEQAELESLLLRSAKLDVPPVSGREAARQRGLEAIGERLRARARRRWAVTGGVLAFAAAIALYVSRPSSPSHVSAERVREAPHRPDPAPTAPLPVAPPRCAALVVAKGDAPLIEDFEHDDSWVLNADGRKGSWITFDDGTGTQSTPSRSGLFPSRIPGGRGASKQGLHVTGGHFNDWGVTFGTELADAACYDASAYAGIEFWAKGPGEIRVGMQMIDVQDVKYGGFCQADCYDTHRKIIELSPSFQKYVVRWDELHQLYVAGPPVAFDPRRVRFLEFGIAAKDTPFDVWIDDVSFVSR